MAFNKCHQQNDEEFMCRALELGERGRRSAPPNPWVGCLLVGTNGQRILGEGAHMKAGTAHAEVLAIQAAIDAGNGPQLEGATLYTTLEPCSHFGRTPPCTDLIIKHKLGRVVIALADPDNKVNGRGIEKLRNANISITLGVLEQKAKESLGPYLYHRATGLPYVVLKLATTMDGKIADSHCADGKLIITGKAAHEDLHQRWRATSQAIIVGAGTAAIDNPRLTLRMAEQEEEEEEDANAQGSNGQNQLLRIVIGTQWGSKWQLGTNLLDTSQGSTLLCTTADAKVPDEWHTRHGVEVLRMEETSALAFKHEEEEEEDEEGRQNSHKQIDLRGLLVELGKRDILQVLVEGGAKLAANFLHSGLVNRLVLYQTAKLMGNRGLPWAKHINTRHGVEVLRMEETSALAFKHEEEEEEDEEGRQNSHKQIDLRGLLVELGKRDILQVLVEGGAKLAANFLHSGLVNRLVLYQTAKLMGNRGLPWAKHINLEEMNVSGMPTNEWKLDRVNIIDESDFCVEYVKMT